MTYLMVILEIGVKNPKNSEFVLIMGACLSINIFVFSWFPNGVSSLTTLVISSGTLRPKVKRN